MFGIADPTLAPGQTRLDAWTVVNLAQMSEQVQGQLLQVYVIAAPDPSQADSPQPVLAGGGVDSAELPYRAVEQPDLSEGPHMSYAIQWFSFAAILAVGYPFFIWKQLRDEKSEL